MTELAHRTGNGIDVVLLWDRQTNDVTVEVHDERDGTGFRLRVDRRKALDAFYHPFAYAPAEPSPDGLGVVARGE
jgi:hypothetical protein